MTDVENVMQQLHQSVLELNGCLERDRLCMVAHNQKALDESNIEKLTINNTINQLLLVLQSNQISMLSVSIQQKWSAIEASLVETNTLLAINQKVLQSNLSFYSGLFNQVTQALGENEVFTYNVGD